MPPSSEDDQAPEQGGAQPLPGTARAVREVDVLPDGRRVTWYAGAEHGDVDRA